MKWIIQLFFSSIGRKFFMAVSGLMLSGFMLFHFAENLLLFKGQYAYDTYVEMLLGIPLIPAAEIGLAAIFFLHIITGAWVRWEDWKCRPVGYARKNSAGGKTIGSSTMLYTAFALLAYLAYHIANFRYGDHSRGFYYLVTTTFQNPEFTAVYVFGSMALALHLSHGFQSAFQTLGVNHPRYTPAIKSAGWAVAAAMVGFASISIWFLVGGA